MYKQLLNGDVVNATIDVRLTLGVRWKHIIALRIQQEGEWSVSEAMCQWNIGESHRSVFNSEREACSGIVYRRSRQVTLPNFWFGNQISAPTNSSKLSEASKPTTKWCLALSKALTRRAVWSEYSIEMDGELVANWTLEIGRWAFLCSLCQRLVVSPVYYFIVDSTELGNVKPIKWKCEVL